MNLCHKKPIAVLGAGASGIAATKLLLQKGFLVTLLDNKPFDNLKNNLSSCITDHPRFTFLSAINAAFNAFNFSALILSPGVPKSHPLIKKTNNSQIPILSEVDLAALFLPPSLKVGITGTNGKSTVTAMLQDIFSKCGFHGIATGNFGTPLSEIAAKPIDKMALAVELSSFQLEDTRKLSLDVAILLNLTPDHCERYESLAEYLAAKKMIFNLVSSGKPIWIHESVKPLLAKAPVNAKWFSTQNALNFARQNNLPFSPHDAQNAFVSFLTAQSLGLNEELTLKALKSFTPLPYRCQLLGEKKGLQFINDSKSTNTICTQNALQAYKNNNVHLILGGIHKNDDFATLGNQYFPCVKKYYIYGESKLHIKNQLHLNPVHLFNNLQEAFLEAVTSACPGDVILLSPACASFDQYKNYMDRGEHFLKLFQEF